MRSPKYQLRDFIDVLFLKRVSFLSAVLFFLFLLGRFSGFTFFPEWRIMNLAVLGILLLPSSISSFLKTRSAEDTPFTSLTLSLSSYALFTFLFILYLKLDIWFMSFIRVYSMDLFHGNENDFGFLMLAEGLQFSIVISLLAYFLSDLFSDKRIYTE